MITKSKIINRFSVIFILFIIAGFLLFLKLFALKTILKKKYRQYANTLVTKKIYGQRGNIYSLNKNIIATTAITFDIYWDSYTDYLRQHPKIVKENLYALADSLARYFNVPVNKVYSSLKESYDKKRRYVLITKGLKFSQVERLKNFPIFNLGKIKGGFIVEKRNHRVHPMGNLALRTIGTFHGENSNLNTGIERFYNAQLTGKQGIVVFRKGPAGTRIEEQIIIPPENGCDVLSTLDMNIQYYLATELNKRLQELKADQGIGIVLDVQTGEVRAMVNLILSPKDSIYYESVNNAVKWLYEPGSIMKPLAMIALLEEYDIALNKKVETKNGKIYISGHLFRDDKKGGYGTISVKKVIEISSNVGMVKLINQYFSQKPNLYIDRLREIGIDRKTGIDLEGEVVQNIKDPSSSNWWGNVSIGQLAIGYEHKMTPLQIVSLYNAIANKGIYVSPYLVKGFICNGKEIPNNTFKVEKRIIASLPTIEKIHIMLRGVVLRGTAKSYVNSKIVSIAGKTGTAQIFSHNLGYSSNYNTTFVGYFPSEKPLYSMIIVIKNPKKDKSGALAAGPVFRKVAEKIYLYDKTRQVSKKQIVNYWTKKKVLPKVKNGLYQDIFYLVKYFNLPYTDNVKANTFIKVYTYSDYLDLLPFKKTKTVYNSITLSAKDAAFLYSYYGYLVQLQGLGVVVSEKKIGKKTVKLYLK